MRRAKGPAPTPFEDSDGPDSCGHARRGLHRRCDRRARVVSVLVAGALALAVGAVPAVAETLSGRPATTVTRADRPAANPWETPIAAEERGLFLARAASAEVAHRGVPVPLVEMSDLDAALGQFDHGTWLVQLSRRALEVLAEPPASPLRETVAAAVRHELRHAEQWFRMAQLRAGDGQQVAEIAVELSIPVAVAAAAAQSPLSPANAQAQLVRSWWVSVYGPGREHRNSVLAAMLSTKASFDRAAARYAASPSPLTRQAMVEARTEFAPAYAAYLALPEESDAFTVSLALKHPGAHP